MRLDAAPLGRALITLVAVLASPHSGDAAFLPAARLPQELHADATSSRRGGPAPGAIRMHRLDVGAALSSSTESLDESLRVGSRFTSDQGVFGEVALAGTPRHPFWHFEGHQLGTFRSYVCCAVLFLAGMLCAAGGIGGGGIYVTLLMVAGKLGVADAVPLSKAIVFFGSLSSWALNSRKLVSWETKREMAIDYNICRLIMPGSLCGTLIGVILNRRLPSWIILAVLCAILVAITISVGWTTIKLHLEERAQDLEDERVAQEAAREVVEAARVANEKLRAGTVLAYAPNLKLGTEGWKIGVGGMPVVPPAAGPDTSLVNRPRRASGVRRPSMNAPDVTKMRNRVLWSDIILALGILLIVITAGVFRFHASECLSADLTVQKGACNPPVLLWLGQGTLESLMRHSNAGSAIRLCTILVPLCLCAAVECYYATLLIKCERWRPKETVLYSVVATLTGCLSGLVGIGGGLIFSPFLLLSGVHPSVAVATSSTCVIFTSASTSLQYLLTDRIILSLTLVYGAVGVAASYLGTSFAHFLEERFWGRKSYVSLIVGLGVLISTALSVTKLACTRPH